MDYRMIEYKVYDRLEPVCNSLLFSSISIGYYASEDV